MGLEMWQAEHNKMENICITYSLDWRTALKIR